MFRRMAVQEAGFTLVELLISILVAGVLLSSVNSIYTNQLYISQRARDTTIANSYVEAKVESLRSKGFLGVPNGTTNITSELPGELATPRSASLVVSNQTVSVKRIVITVNYNQQGKTQTFLYTTYLGELGVGQY